MGWYGLGECVPSLSDGNNKVECDVDSTFTYQQFLFIFLLCTHYRYNHAEHQEPPNINMLGLVTSIMLLAHVLFLLQHHFW